MTTTDQSPMATVCLVDDDAAVLKSISRLLASDGFGVCAFNEPKSFLAHTLKNPVPLVVLDVWMNDMDGLEAQEMVSVLSPGTSVIIITGGEDEHTRETALRAGVFAFFTKPFDDEQFLSAVRNAMALHPAE